MTADCKLVFLFSSNVDAFNFSTFFVQRADWERSWPTSVPDLLMLTLSFADPMSKFSFSAANNDQSQFFCFRIQGPVRFCRQVSHPLYLVYLLQCPSFFLVIEVLALFSALSLATASATEYGHFLIISSKIGAKTTGYIKLKKLNFVAKYIFRFYL